MLMPVVGSVHEEEEALVDVVEVVVVQVMAVLGAVYLWHETRANTPISNAKNGKRLTAPLSLTSRMPIRSSLIAISLPEGADYISSRLAKNLVRFCRSRRIADADSICGFFSRQLHVWPLG